MVGYTYWNGGSIPSLSQSLIKAGLSIGMIAGMIVFGFFGDAVGRHKVYGKELIFTLLGTFMIVMTPWNNFSEQSVISWMTVWRVVTGFGVGGGEFFNVKVYGDVVLSPIRLPYVRVDE
jgi:PHS family inorganic phosphate transporter-like MFS transporter